MPDQDFDASVGGNVDGELNVAGRDIINVNTNGQGSINNVAVLGIILGFFLVVIVVIVLVLSGNNRGTPPVVSELATATTEPMVEEPFEPTETAQPTPTEAPTATPTEAPTEESEPTAEPSATEAPGPVSEVVYDSIFVGWPPTSTSNATTSSVATGYQIEVQPNWEFWATDTSQPTVEGFTAEMTVEAKLCPASDSAYGFYFQRLRDNRFAYFIISCDGTYTMVDQTSAAPIPLASGDLPEGIDPSTGTHFFSARAFDNEITVSVDGTEVVTVPVDSIAAGAIGPYVNTGLARVQIVYRGLTISSLTLPGESTDE